MNDYEYENSSMHIGIAHQARFPQHLAVEDLETSYSQQSLYTVIEDFIPNKVVVESFPPGTEDFVLQLYLQNLSQPVSCTEVKIHGNVAIATFAGAIGMPN